MKIENREFSQIMKPRKFPSIFSIDMETLEAMKILKEHG